MGHLNPNWKGDAVKEISARSRTQRWFTDIGPCSICGEERSERHHRDGDTRNNEPQNIVILCRRCHMKEDGRLASLLEMSAKMFPSMVARGVDLRRKQTHCKRGHLLSGDNLYVYRGFRCCKTCNRLKMRARKRAQDSIPPERWRVKQD